MLLKQVRYFAIVVENNSFTKAAEICFISQSAISQQIKALENELGVDLMIRKNRQFTLTPAGEYLYRHGLELVEEFDTLVQETKRRGEDKELTLKIGYLKGQGSQELHQAIANFSSIYPEVSLSIVHGTHEELYELLKNELVDLVISDQRRAFNHDYYNYELAYSDCYVEISSLHPLSKKEYLTLEDIKRISCILISTKEQQNNEKEYYQHTLGFSNQFLFASTLEEARLMVVSNRGFLPMDALKSLSKTSMGITRIPLYHKQKPLQRKYCAFWHKERTNYYIEEFVEMIRQCIQKDS